MTLIDLKEAKQSDVLARLINTIHLTDDVIDIFVEASKQLSQAVKCDYVNILFNNDQAKYFYINHALNQTSSELGNEVIIPYNETSITEIIRSHRLIVRDDLTGRGKFTPGDLKFLADGIKSDLSVPIMCKNRVFAIINLSSYESHYFSENFQHQTEQIASLLGLALERTELIEKLSRKQSDLLFWKNKFSCLKDTINDAMAVIRLDYDLIYETNPAFQRLTGYTPDELHGIRLSHLHPGQEELLLSNLDKCSQQDKLSAINQLNLKPKDGSPIPVKLRFVYVGGEIIKFVFAIYQSLSDKGSAFFQANGNNNTNHEFTQLQLSTFSNIAKLVESNLKLDRMIQAALSEIYKVINFDYAQVSLFDADNENVENHTIISDQCREYDDSKDWNVMEDIDFFWYNISKQNLKQQFENHSNNPAKIERELGSKISAVLTARSQCPGTLLLGSLKKNHYQGQEIEFIKQISVQLAILIENNHLAEKHKKMTLSDAAKSDLKKITGTNLSMDNVLAGIANLSVEKMQAQLATIQLIENDSPLPDITVSDLECNKTFISNYEKENIIPVILESSEPYVIEHIPFDDLEQLKCSVSKILSDYITCVAIPLKLNQKTIGVISNYWNKPYQLNQDSQLLLTAIAEQASEAIGNAKLYQESIYRNERLEKAREELENFISTVSHNLKTPLASIQGFASTVLDNLKEEINDDSLSYLQKIRKKAIKMQQYIDALNQLANVGRLVHPLEEVNVLDIVEQAKMKFSDILQQKNIRLVIAKDLPDIHCDRSLIQQVLENLIESAIRHLDESNKRSKIEIGYQNRVAEHIFFVRNNGTKIKREFTGTIFELFNPIEGQEDEDKSYELSLAIAKKIIEMHDGQIWFESVAGKGNTVYISLPRRKF